MSDTELPRTHNLFFVDLEPSGNNKDIYKITRLQNSVIEIQPPRKGKHIVQCTRCQLYRPYVCVKCGGQHNTATCKKDTTPATCALCGRGHPANYKGCGSIKNTITPSSLPKGWMMFYPSQRPLPQPQAIPRPQYKIYAQALRGTEPTLASPNVDEPMSLSTFLGEYKAMFQQTHPTEHYGSQYAHHANKQDKQWLNSFELRSGTPTV